MSRGVRATSIQQIADKVGISKGAVYLQFKSKDEIIWEIISQMDRDTSNKVRVILEDDTLSPDEKMRRQILCQLEDVAESQAFQQSLFSDQALKLDEELLQYIQEYRYRWLHLQQAFLLRVYGEDVRPWVLDLAQSLDAMVQNFLSLIAIEKISTPKDKIVNWLSWSINALVSQCLQDKPEAVLDDSSIPDMDEIQRQAEARQKEQVEKAMLRLEQRASELSVSADKRKTLESSLTHLRAHLDDEDPTLLRALLAGLRTYKGLSSQREHLAQLLQVELV